ncbi:hypothetical protein B0H19DRAFT_1296421 [Mycena capillaripes]|nr:hypothetical protein B0H19DRAFT_1296421 [Mycena capillaripes]
MGIPLSVRKITLRNLWAALQPSHLCGRPTWNENDMPDLSGQVVISTGGNSGPGKETVGSRKKAEMAIVELRALTRKEALFLEMDLASLSSIKAENFVSFLSHFYLTKLLLPLLIPAAALHPTTGRVVNLTSVIHYIAIPNYNSFKDGRTNAVLLAELARRYGDQGIISVVVNPGIFLEKRAEKKWGVLGQLWAGTSAEGAMLNCKYVAPWGTIRSPREDVNDLINGTEL